MTHQLNLRHVGFFVTTIVALMLSSPAARSASTALLPRFTNPASITNPYHPFEPGGTKVFVGIREDQPSAIFDLYLTSTRKFTLAGKHSVQCRILQETEFIAGELVEISHNFFAQSDDGAVYYFGELVDLYDHGTIVSHEGSWLVGGPTQPNDPIDTAEAAAPGLFMPANPQLGDTFKPENVFPIVDETDKVRRVDVAVMTPAGPFHNTVQLRETSRLDSDIEDKWYAPGVGVVKGVATGNETFILVISTLGHKIK